MTPKLVYLMSSLQNVPSPQNNFSQKISVAEKILDIFLRNAPSAPNSPQKTNPCWDSLKPAVWFPCICLGRFFTFYHGKSPLNQHVFFSNHHKQIEVSWVCPYRGRHGFACIGLWLVFLWVLSLPKIIQYQVCRFVPYTCSETKPRMLPTDLNIGSKVWLWFKAMFDIIPSSSYLETICLRWCFDFNYIGNITMKQQFMDPKILVYFFNRS